MENKQELRERSEEFLGKIEIPEREAEKEIFPETEKSAEEDYHKESEEKESVTHSVTAGAAGKPAGKSTELQQIENILEEDLGEVYFKMAPDKQKEFREKGEETAGKIALVFHKVKVNIGKIVSLIRDWLKVIPGVSKYFLEQESKIKADKILKIKK